MAHCCRPLSPHRHELALLFSPPLEQRPNGKFQPEASRLAAEQSRAVALLSSRQLISGGRFRGGAWAALSLGGVVGAEARTDLFSFGGFNSGRELKKKKEQEVASRRGRAAFSPQLAATLCLSLRLLVPPGETRNYASALNLVPGSLARPISASLPPASRRLITLPSVAPELGRERETISISPMGSPKVAHQAKDAHLNSRPRCPHGRLSAPTAANRQEPPSRRTNADILKR